MRLAMSLVLVAGCDQAFGLTIAAPDAKDAPVAVDAPSTGLTGVVARFRMDEAGPAGGPCLLDDSGHDVTGECIGDPVSIIGGQVGGAFAFDGNTRIQIASTATGPFTIAGWFKQTSTPFAGMCPFNRLFGTTGGDSWQVCVSDLATTFYYQGAADISGSALTEDVWTHLAIVSTGAAVTSYINGAPLVPDSMGALEFDGSPIMIGADIDGATLTEPVIGAIDDVWIFDRALSRAEIIALESPI